LKIRSVAIALCGVLIGAPAHAKTFVGVLWPMFGPLPAIGLVELVAELKMMPDVEVETYVHQAWPSLVDDLEHQPAGTHTVVVGYSLGANSSVFVANNAKYIDLIVALQPSMLSWNPPLTGKVGRMIEIYNPNPWMTWGGMGSKKLVGENIEYIENNDSHPGAQFNSDFRNLVKTEIAKFNTQDQAVLPEIAQAAPPTPVEPAPPAQSTMLGFAEEQAADRPTAKGRSQIAQGEKPTPLKPPKPAAPPHVAQESPNPEPKNKASDGSRHWAAFIDGLSNSVNAGDVSVERELTRAAMADYAKRTYGISASADDFNGTERVGWLER
jgi:hypothetical protein